MKAIRKAPVVPTLVGNEGTLPHANEPLIASQSKACVLHHGPDQESRNIDGDQRNRQQKSHEHDGGIFCSTFLRLSTAAVGGVLLLLSYLMPTTQAQGFDVGINFRGTSTYVTDGTNETYCLADAYPTTRGGATFGWNSSVSAADRNSGLDRRLAGINFNGAGPDTFRLDLPSTGSYTVYLSLGDAAASHADNQVIVKDNTTTLLTIGPHLTDGTNSFYDATDTAYDSTNWPTSQMGSSLSFSSTILILEMSAAANWTITHLRVVGSGGGGGGAPARGLMFGVMR